ncbi:hypothetical protein NMY22_g9288 [Coprinellus aureogranulatus]|nr:hypothetical protein NMY22_g9288 [Coprinellus aureogranulatus]
MGTLKPSGPTRTAIESYDHEDLALQVAPQALGILFKVKFDLNLFLRVLSWRLVVGNAGELGLNGKYSLRACPAQAFAQLLTPLLRV